MTPRPRTEPERAKARAMRLLTARARTSAELIDRLAAAGFASALADATVADLTRAGLVNDRAVGAQIAAEATRRAPLSRSALEAKLRGRRLDAETARAVAGEIAPNDAAAAAQAGRAYLARGRTALTPDVLRRRLGAFLARRGFEGELVEEVVASLVGEQG